MKSVNTNALPINPTGGGYKSKQQKAVISNGQVSITWDGWRDYGKVSYTKATAVRELINNVLVDKKFNRKVHVQVLIDSKTKKLYVTDDFYGFDPYTMKNTMDIGQSYLTPAILSEHGNGMKTGITWFGELDYIRSTKDGHDFVELLPDRSEDKAAHMVVKSNDVISQYSVKSQEWIPQQSQGAQICVNLFDNQIPKQVNWWKNLKRDLEKSYFEHLGKNGTLDIQLVWIDGGVLKWSEQCIKHNILLSSPVQAQKTNKSFIGKEKKLGPNEWCIDDVFICPDTDIKVQVKVGRVPHPKNVETYYGEKFPPPEDYNPEVYNDSPFTYASDTMGLSYCKKWIPISFGNFKATSRSADLFGLINIMDGIETVKTKDNIKRTADVEIFEKNLEEWLKDEKAGRGIRVRAQAGYMSMSETAMEKNLLEKLKKSSKLRKYLGYTTSEFDNQWPLHSGIPDIVNLDTKTVKSIIELKKEGNNRLYKGLFQGMVYAEESKVKRILIVAQDDVLPSEIQIKVDVLIQSGWEIRYEQYQKLMDL